VARPNVCIVILESWSADLIESLGGYSGVTPNFEKLISEGYLFTHIKPAGHVSDQGVPAVLSGYPALPIGSAINQPERQVDLANINNQFSAAGYYSSFFFGGQLIYGNIKTYIFRNGFNRVTEQQDLPSSIPSGKLGIHDSIMLSVWHDSLNAYKQPFFSSLFTQSTHAPFDAPQAKVITWGDGYVPYLNSAVYADRQLGAFFEAAKKEPWYDNTIFILVADHSHGTPKDYSYDSPEFYHIPLLIYGGALKEEFRGVKNDRLASQTDIASTLLHQLGYSSAPYRWSKNLMNPYSQQFAFYTFDEGFGFVDTSGTIIWNKKFPSESRNMGKTPEDKDLLYKKGAAMLQVLMNDFLSK
jgi:phosphoglycerol transferase MdoB-like AlkP superfamily enzyme